MEKEFLMGSAGRLTRAVFLQVVLAALVAAAARGDAEPGAGVPAHPAGRGLEALQAYAATLEGEPAEAAAFLLASLPAADREGLPLDLFRENLEQAFIARRTYPWTRDLPRELFFNDVLPYAVADESRDPWRKRLRELFHPDVAGCTTLPTAADAVASRIVERTGVVYGTEREKACQSPAESMRQGKASCTGLSILMVDALRAVGLPARLVAIPQWGHISGNHTWVEIHDGRNWRKTGHAEGSAGWDKGWEISHCAFCDPGNPLHGVFAASYRPTDVGFPAVWSWRSAKGGPVMGLDDLLAEKRGPAGELVSLEWKLQPRVLHGIDRTAHYIALAGGRKAPIPEGSGYVAVRAFLEGAGTRVDVPVRVCRDGLLLQEVRTASEAQDRNDYARVLCPEGKVAVEYRVADGTWRRVEAEAKAGQETAVRIELSAADAGGFLSVAQRRALADWFRNPRRPWPGGADWPVPGDAAAVRRALETLWSIHCAAERTGPASQDLGPLPPPLVAPATSNGASLRIPGGILKVDGYRMPFMLVRKEPTPPPATGRALYLCMHGGGANPEVEGPHAWPVNTREWQTQAMFAATRYAGEGLYFVPRMPDDRRGRWWHAHIQDAFEQVIRHALREWQVDPDRVYILGISEGAFGTLILAPNMADRFGGANAMAGGESDAVPVENLRNLALRTDVGENDTMFNRVGMARDYHARIEAARERHGGYVHCLDVKPGCGHAIDYTAGVKWMIGHRRNARPDTVVWTARPLDDRRRPALYWLGLRPARPDQKVRLVGRLRPGENAIELEVTPEPAGASLEGTRVSLLLDDTMLDLDREVAVIRDGRRVFFGRVERRLETLARTLMERGDPQLAFPARIDLDL